jgi:hypothetical protein
VGHCGAFGAGLMFCAFGFNLMDESVECDSCTAWAARKWRSTKVLNLSTRPTLAPDGAPHGALGS